MVPYECCKRFTDCSCCIKQQKLTSPRMSLRCAEMSPHPSRPEFDGRGFKKGIFKALKSYWKKNNANYEFLLNSYLLSHRLKHFGIAWKTLRYTPLRSCSTFLKYSVSQTAEYRNPLETTFFLFFFLSFPLSLKKNKWINPEIKFTVPQWVEIQIGFETYIVVYWLKSYDITSARR